MHRFPDAHWSFLSTYPILYFSDRNSFRYLDIRHRRFATLQCNVGRDCSFYEPPQIEEFCDNVASLTCMQVHHWNRASKIGFVVKLILQGFHTDIV